MFKPRLGADWIVGVVGALQFEVLADRASAPSTTSPVTSRHVALRAARWVEADDAAQLKKFEDANHATMAEDHDGAPVFLARNGWHLKSTGEDWPQIRFLKTKEQVQ